MVHNSAYLGLTAFRFANALIFPSLMFIGGTCQEKEVESF